MKDTEFEIFHGDTLTNEWDTLRELNPAKKPSFDAIDANPPLMNAPAFTLRPACRQFPQSIWRKVSGAIFASLRLSRTARLSYRWEPTGTLGDDVRFKNHGLAPKSAADFAFLLHGFHFLKDEGVMAIILPHGVLFRGGAEERIRTKLLKDGQIDTVIGLPANLFSASSPNSPRKSNLCLRSLASLTIRPNGSAPQVKRRIRSTMTPTTRCMASVTDVAWHPPAEASQPQAARPITSSCRVGWTLPSFH